jgi:RNA polymerase sigma factor (sigma-70 family)
MKIFMNLKSYNHDKSFKSWLRRIMINASIDFFRRNERHYHTLDISHAQLQVTDEDVLDHLSAEEIIQHIQNLPSSYRIVFNLFVMEGYKHEEIAKELNISVGTSKSNLSIARSKLQRMILNDRGTYKAETNG